MHDIFDIACNFTSERFDGDLEEIINRGIDIDKLGKFYLGFESYE